MDRPLPLVAPHLEALIPYIPGKPIEETEREYGVTLKVMGGSSWDEASLRMVHEALSRLSSEERALARGLSIVRAPAMSGKREDGTEEPYACASWAHRHTPAQSDIGIAEAGQSCRRVGTGNRGCVGA